MLNHLHRKLSGSDSHASGSMQGWGKSYDRMVSLLSFGQEQKFRQSTLKLARIQPGERILEVGCGTGTLTLAAKAQAGPHSQVCGIDVAPDMIETARHKAAQAGREIEFQLSSIAAIPYPDGQFDLVLSSLMLHHLPGDALKRQGMQEVLRVLKPGGRLLIVDVAVPKNGLVHALASMVVGRGMMAHPVAEYIPLLEQVGFVKIETGPTQSSFLAYLSGKREQNLIE